MLVLRAHESDVEHHFSLNKAMIGDKNVNLGLEHGSELLRVNSYEKAGILLPKYNLSKDLDENKEDL